MTISATTQGLRMGVATSSSRPAAPFDGQVISETDTDSLKVYNGTAWVDVSPKIAIFNETQAASTTGGTFTSGAWQTRTLNTTVVNNITSCSLASNAVSLPAGTYYMRAVAPAFQVNEHQVKIYNSTDSTDVVLGTQVYNYSTMEVTGTSEAKGVVTITGTKSFVVQHRCTATKTSQGFGTAITWGNCIFSTFEITRIA